MKPKRIVLTGATGWIGSNVLKRIVTENAEILAIGRKQLSFTKNDGANVCYLRKDLKELKTSDLISFKPDYCIHLAWFTKPVEYWRSPINYECMKNSQVLIERCLEVGVQRFFIAGSCAEYQPCEKPIEESHLLNTQSDSAYIQSKLNLLDWINKKFKHSDTGTSWVWGRIFYPFGPGAPKGKLTDWLWDRLSRGEPVELKYPHSIKDYIHIDDVSEAIWRLTMSEIIGPANIGTGQGISILEIAQLMQKKIGSKSGVITESDHEWRTQNPDPLPKILADTKKLDEIGFKPQMTPFTTESIST